MSTDLYAKILIVFSIIVMIWAVYSVYVYIKNEKRFKEKYNALIEYEKRLHEYEKILHDAEDTGGRRNHG